MDRLQRISNAWSNIATAWKSLNGMYRNGVAVNIEVQYRNGYGGEENRVDGVAMDKLRYPQSSKGIEAKNTGS